MQQPRTPRPSAFPFAPSVIVPIRSPSADAAPRGAHRSPARALHPDAPIRVRGMRSSSPVRFVRAKSDTIPSLKPFNGNAKPLFLFYCGGEEVGKVEGADMPAIVTTITEKAPKLAA